MKVDVWEDMISINSRDEAGFETLGSIADYKPASIGGNVSLSGAAEFSLDPYASDLEALAAKDVAPLPTTADREGYYGDDHYRYWLSGWNDMRLLRQSCEKHAVNLRSYLDFGAASGRVVRHFANSGAAEEVYGTDINRRHVDWMNTYLPKNVAGIHTHSIPVLPFEDNSLDLISAFSVFTHIEAFDTAWIMEFRRILRPGGIAWLTVHSENTWEDVREGWPLHMGLNGLDGYEPDPAKRAPLTDPRKVFRWRADASYSSNVFYTFEHLRSTWGRIMPVKEEISRELGFQDIVILQKPR